MYFYLWLTLFTRTQEEDKVCGGILLKTVAIAHM